MIALELPVRPRQATAAVLTALLVSAACGGLGMRPHTSKTRAARQVPRAELAETMLPEGEVRLWLTIEFDSRGAYLMKDREDQGRVLRSLHGKIINDVGFQNLQKLGPYKATNDLLEGGFPAEGMTILAKRGLEAISGTAVYKPTPACPPGASCRGAKGATSSPGSSRSCATTTLDDPGEIEAGAGNDSGEAARGGGDEDRSLTRGAERISAFLASAWRPAPLIPMAAAGVDAGPGQEADGDRE
jgi:hypothetical protein